VKLKRAKHLLLLALFSTSPLFSQSEPSSEDYQVYSAFLLIQLNGRRGIDDLRVGKNASTLSPDIAWSNKQISRKELLDVKERLPGIEPEVLDSLSECTSKSYRLSRKLMLPSEYTLIDPDRGTGPRGYIEFSCVGMNRSKTQAAFYVSRLRCDCAVGKWILMSKDSNGHWAVVKESIVFIA